VPLKAPPPTKKPAVGTASSSKPVAVKKEAKPTAVKDAKSDYSFFSAPKAKPKLPSFKKAPPAPAPAALNIKREPGTNATNTAQPSSIDPFQEALKSMKARKDSPVVSTPPSVPTPPLVLQQTQAGVAKNGKLKKSVSWAPEGKLESIRFIEKAVYDDDPVDVSYLSFLYVGCVFYLTVHLFFRPTKKRLVFVCFFE
jgi:protein phosphatase 1 regulatory subunit 10